MAITRNSIKNRDVIRKQRHERFAPYCIQAHKKYGQSPTPLEQPAHYGTTESSIGRTYGLANKCLTGIGKSVHEITEDGEQLHEQGIDGQFHATLCRSCRNEHEMHNYKAEGTKEQ